MKMTFIEGCFAAYRNNVLKYIIKASLYTFRYYTVSYVTYAHAGLTELFQIIQQRYRILTHFFPHLRLIALQSWKELTLSVALTQCANAKERVNTFLLSKPASTCNINLDLCKE